VATWLRSSELQPFVESTVNGWNTEVSRLLALPGEGPGVQGREPVAPEDNRPVHPMVDSWQRHRFFEGLAQAVLASGRPTLLVLDDLQWCDEETINWLGFLLNRGSSIPLLVAATARTGEGNSRSAAAGALRAYLPADGVQDISLPPLDVAGTAQLAESFADRALTSREQQLLYDASGGYPLYIVEAARTLPVPAEAGAVPVPDEARTLPTSEGISAILESRLSQASDEAREIAELASAVGREFGLDLLVAASGQEEQAVVRAVDELWRHGILRQQSGGYDFSHDLLRTAAYAGISPPRRWFFHRRIAHSLELLHADSMDGVAAQVATQFELAGAPDRALEYYERAGDLSTRLFANAQALSDYQQCIDLLAGMPRGPERDSRELEILRKMPAPLTALRGYAHPQLRSVLEHIVELSGQLERRDVQLTGLIGLFAATFVQGETGLAHRIGQRSLVLAAQFPQLEGQAHFAYAGTAVSLGRPLEAVQHFELASALSPDSYSYILGTRIEVHARAWCAHAYWLTGERNRASEAAAEAVERGRASHHPYSLAVALAYAAVLHQIQCADDEPMAATQQDLRPPAAVAAFAAEARELRQICERYDFEYYGHWGQILEGWARGGAAGLEDVRTGIGNLRTSGSFARMPYWLSLEADLLQDDGAARAVLAAAEAAAYQRDDLWWLPEILRKRAALEERPAATALLQRARELAIEQQSPALARRMPSG
jgi:tetratricopeptide (TPR) repeat protein